MNQCPPPAIVGSSVQNNGFHKFRKKGDTTMKKLTVRYIRYVLVLLANVGFKLSLN
jgi:hypothetical protein